MTRRDFTKGLLAAAGMSAAGCQSCLTASKGARDPFAAVLECKARDHYFPVKRPAAERSASWDIFVRDWADREIGFSLS